MDKACPVLSSAVGQAGWVSPAVKLVLVTSSQSSESLLSCGNKFFRSPCLWSEDHEQVPTWPGELGTCAQPCALQISSCPQALVLLSPGREVLLAMLGPVTWPGL